MKVIVSHDIDHISASEHYFKDLIVPKHLVRSKIEFVTGKIGVGELANRYMEIFRNKWHNLDELQTFNKQHSLPNAFFIGVQNGLGLSYSLSLAQAAVSKLQKEKNSIYLHGIAYQDLNEIKGEKLLFEQSFGFKASGIRMHYVRKDETTLQRFSDAGFLFDSTMYEFKDPYKVDKMWEFPFQIMDGWIIEAGKRRQTRNLHESKEETKKIIEKAQKSGLNYLGIDFHDRYFSKSFKTWMNWYVWLIEYLKENKIGFVDFENAVKTEEAKLSVVS